MDWIDWDNMLTAKPKGSDRLRWLLTSASSLFVTPFEKISLEDFGKAFGVRINDIRFIEDPGGDIFSTYDYCFEFVYNNFSVWVDCDKDGTIHNNSTVTIRKLEEAEDTNAVIIETPTDSKASPMVFSAGGFHSIA